MGVCIYKYAVCICTCLCIPSLWMGGGGEWQAFIGLMDEISLGRQSLQCVVKSTVNWNMMESELWNPDPLEHLILGISGIFGPESENQESLCWGQAKERDMDQMARSNGGDSRPWPFLFLASASQVSSGGAWQSTVDTMGWSRFLKREGQISM